MTPLLVPGTLPPTDLTRGRIVYQKPQPEREKLKPGDSVIATNTCTGWAIDQSEGSYVQASRGAKFSVGEASELNITHGQLLLRGGTDGLAVKTNYLSFILPEGAIAIVDAERKGSSRVTLLDDQEKNGALVLSNGLTYIIHRGDKLTAEQVRTAHDSEIPGTQTWANGIEPATAVSVTQVPSTAIPPALAAGPLPGTTPPPASQGQVPETSLANAGSENTESANAKTDTSAIVAPPVPPLPLPVKLPLPYMIAVRHPQGKLTHKTPRLALSPDATPIAQRTAALPSAQPVQAPQTATEPASKANAQKLAVSPHHAKHKSTGNSRAYSYYEVSYLGGKPVYTARKHTYSGLNSQHAQAAQKSFIPQAIATAAPYSTAVQPVTLQSAPVRTVASAATSAPKAFAPTGSQKLAAPTTASANTVTWGQAAAEAVENSKRANAHQSGKSVQSGAGSGSQAAAVVVMTAPVALDKLIASNPLIACTIPSIRHRLHAEAGGNSSGSKKNQGLADKFKGARTNLPKEDKPKNTIAEATPVLTPVPAAAAAAPSAPKPPTQKRPLKIAKTKPLAPQRVAKVPAHDTARYTPVSFGAPPSVKATAPAARSGSKPPQVAAIDPNLIPTGAGSYRLSSGAALLKPSAPMRVDVPGAAVYAGPNSVVHVSVEGSVIRVIDLHDKSSKSVAVSYDGQTFSMLPGSELSIVVGPADAAGDIIMSDGIARRDMRILAFETGHYVVVNDVSIVSALIGLPRLVELRRSPESNDKGLVGSMLKTAAALGIVLDAKRGPFTAGAPVDTQLADSARVQTY